MLSDLIKIVVPMLALLCALFSLPATSHAGEVVMAMENGYQGHSYLTMEPCDLNVNSGDTAGFHRAYSLSYEDTPDEIKYEGCWIAPTPPIEEMSPEERAVLQRTVTILTEYGVTINMLMRDFHPAEVINTRLDIAP